MKRYEVLMAKELFAGSDIVRKFSYKRTFVGGSMPFFSKQIVLCAAHRGCIDL